MTNVQGARGLREVSLTLTGLAISGREEAHVTFTAVAARQVQTVATLTQVAIVSALIAVCGGDHQIESQRHHPCGVTESKM